MISTVTIRIYGTKANRLLCIDEIGRNEDIYEGNPIPLILYVYTALQQGVNI
jgi:hypothetical protein